MTAEQARHCARCGGPYLPAYDVAALPERVCGPCIRMLTINGHGCPRNDTRPRADLYTHPCRRPAGHPGEHAARLPWDDLSPARRAAFARALADRRVTA